MGENKNCIYNYNTNYCNLDKYSNYTRHNAFSIRGTVFAKYRVNAPCCLIELYNFNNILIERTLTNRYGEYFFNNIFKGKYKVRIIPHKDYELSKSKVSNINPYTGLSNILNIEFKPICNLNAFIIPLNNCFYC